MNERAPLPETLTSPPRGRVLALVPHADDDVIGCGGTLAKHVAQGDEVTVVVVFDGRRGDPEELHDAEAYVERRRQEARSAGAVLGLADYHFWDYPEGHEPSGPELASAARRIADLMRSQRPDLVYAPWIGEHHLDHHVLARGVRLALEATSFAGEAWGFEVWTPLVATRIVDVTEVQDAKRKALELHRSQIEAIPGFLDKALSLQAQRAMYLAPESRFGEGFRPLGFVDEQDRDLLRLLSS